MLVKNSIGQENLCIFAFLLPKTAILGIFDCYFRVSDARKNDFDARKPAP